MVTKQGPNVPFLCAEYDQLCPYRFSNAKAQKRMHGAWQSGWSADGWTHRWMAHTCTLGMLPPCTLITTAMDWHALIFITPWNVEDQGMGVVGCQAQSTLAFLGVHYLACPVLLATFPTPVATFQTLNPKPYTLPHTCRHTALGPSVVKDAWTDRPTEAWMDRLKD
jgi:hypothetical protein